MAHATFADPDVTTFARLDQLGMREIEVDERADSTPVSATSPRCLPRTTTPRSK